MKFQLYKLSKDFRALDELLDEEGGDITGQEEAFEELQRALAEDSNQTIDDMVAYVKNMEPFIEAAQNESKRLAKNAKKLDEMCGKIKGQIKHHLIARGEKKFQTERFTVSVVNNGGALPMEIYLKPDELPEHLRYTVTTIEADKKAIYEAIVAKGTNFVLNDDNKVIAALKERGTRLQIK
jgi:hypothetical protein